MNTQFGWNSYLQTLEVKIVIYTDAGYKPKKRKKLAFSFIFLLSSLFKEYE